MKAALLSLCFIVCMVFSNYNTFSQANQSLSNLTSPTAINVSLQPGKDGKTDLGGKKFSWANVYLKTGIYINGKLNIQAPGTGNFFIGNGAGNSALSGKNNIVFGLFSSSKMAAASFNTIVGDSALYNDSIGNNNCAFGFKSLYNNIQGSYNTALGFDALYVNGYGNANTSVGMYSLYNCTGSFNTAVGYSSLGSVTSGLYNCGFGEGTLSKTQTGIENSAVGYGADVTASNISNATVIGYNAVCDASNKVRIGNTSVSSIGGQVGWTTFSDGRYKKNIKENVVGLAFINKLRPITYTVDISAVDNHYGKMNNDKNANADKIVYTGFIAQEVEATAEKLNYNFSGVDKPSNSTGLYGLRYDNFVVPLVKAVQELSKMNDDKDAKLTSLQSQVDSQQKQIDQLKSMLQNFAHVNADEPKANVFIASVDQNVPNPVSGNTIISYTLSQNFASAQLIVSDKNGTVLQQKNIATQGKGTININTATLSAGIYNYSLYVDGKMMSSKQMVVSR